MPNDPLFTIITVIYNNIAGLKRTAESVHAQTLKDYEWIVIDGGSSDGSAEWLKSSKANWISEPDRGIYDAMNKGIGKSSNQYLLFLNAGDTLAEKDVLQSLSQEIKSQRTAPDFIYGDSLELDQSGKQLNKPARSYKKILSGMFTHHQAMLYRRAALGNLTYSQRYDIAADYDFTLRFLKKTKNILYWPHPICVFEAGGVSQQQALKGRAEQFEIRQNIGVNPNINAAIFITQTATWHFRKLFPFAYWAFKNVRGSSGNKSGG